MTAFDFNMTGPVLTAAAQAMPYYGGAAAAAGVAYAPPQVNPFQQAAGGGGAQTAAQAYNGGAAAIVRPVNRKFKDVDLAAAGRRARQELLAARRAENIDKTFNKAVVKCDLVATVVGSATAAPAKGTAYTPAYTAAALASEATLAVHEIVEASPNLKRAVDINALILELAGLDFSG